ncbi:MAG: hypothetical protein HZB15_15350 [Actinobacteria bacterium]|nr:hypothetical protein [Actinomycetota bacterium]
MTDLIDPPQWTPPSNPSPPPLPEPVPQPPVRGRRSLIAAIAITAVCSSAVGAGAVMLVTNDDTPASAAPITAAPDTPSTSRPAEAIDTPSIVAQTTPSVVSIRVTTSGTNIFQQSVTEEGAGTGFVARADGLIYTNAHVVNDADSVKVTLADRLVGRHAGRRPGDRRRQLARTAGRSDRDAGHRVGAEPQHRHRQR